MAILIGIGRNFNTMFLIWCVYMVLTNSWSGTYDVIAASEANRLPACRYYNGNSLFKYKSNGQRSNWYRLKLNKITEILPVETPWSRSCRSRLDQVCETRAHRMPQLDYLETYSGRSREIYVLSAGLLDSLSAHVHSVAVVKLDTENVQNTATDKRTKSLNK